MKRLILYTLFTGWSISIYAQLTIQIASIPANTPAGSEIFIAGNFNNWNPGNTAYKLTQNNLGNYSITLNIQAISLEFKFTRGSWATVEGTANGGFIPNRTFNYTGGPQTLTLQVAGWENLSGSGNSTAASNVSVLSQNFFMPQLNRNRRIWVYVPPDYYNTEKYYPVLYMQDGQNLFDQSTSFSGEWQVDETLNNLFQQGDDGIIVVGIDNGGTNRINEYSPWVNPQYGGGQGDEYLEFIVNTLKPHVDSVFRTRPQREFTGIMGSSLGALISHFGGIERQDIFGKVGVFSPSYWFSTQAYSHTATIGRQWPMRIYLLAGQLEGGGSVVSQLNAMYDTLRQAGFAASELQKITHNDGQHSEWYWRREFSSAYQWLFADVTTTSLSSLPKSPQFRIFPNPAQNQVQVTGLEDYPQIAVRIYDTQGRLAASVRTLNGNLIDVSKLPKGKYLIQFLSDGLVLGVKKLQIP
jgi:predicted alpha/beta superfamily hydrolase